METVLMTLDVILLVSALVNLNVLQYKYFNNKADETLSILSNSLLTQFKIGLKIKSLEKQVNNLKNSNTNDSDII